MPTTINASAAGTITIGGDLTVNRLGYGAMRLTGHGVWGWPENRQNALAVLRRAVDLGVNFIDTADAYGPHVNEEQIAQALYPYPKDLVIATKAGSVRTGPGEWHGDGRPEYLLACCDASLKRLRVNSIDLFQLHRIDPRVPFAEQVGVLKTLRDAGKIRHAGLSNVTLEQVREARTIVAITSVQNRYNITFRKDSEAIVDLCDKEKMAFLPWFPLDAGDVHEMDLLREVGKTHNSTPYQVALAWLLERSKAMLPIPGTSSLLHLEENIAAGSLRLSDKEYDLLAAH